MMLMFPITFDYFFFNSGNLGHSIVIAIALFMFFLVVFALPLKKTGSPLLRKCTAIHAFAVSVVDHQRHQPPQSLILSAKGT